MKTLIAKQFIANIQRWLTIEERAKVDDRNKIDRDSCATHDFCDANVAMNAAFLSVTGREIDLQNQTEIDLWSDAWGHAIEQEFSK